jgi:hypothetical protein
MKQNINFSQFVDAFNNMDRQDQFTYKGKKALFDYLEQLGEDIGEEIELDVIALCCEYSEYGSSDEAASEYFDYEGMEYGEDGEELDTYEEVEEKALEYLRDRTQVITFDTGIIIQDF